MNRLFDRVRLCAAFCAALFFSVAAVAQIGGPVLGGGTPKSGGPLPGGTDGSICFIHPAGTLLCNDGNITYTVSTTTLAAPISTSTTAFRSPDGSVSVAGYGFTNATNSGLFRDNGTGRVIASQAGNQAFGYLANFIVFGSAGAIAWTSSDVLAAGDLTIVRDAANTLAQKNGANDQIARRYGGNAGFEECGSISENLTLSTGGTTTDTAANLLPANANIKAVTARVTTTVATATSWQLGDATIAGRFTAAQSGAQLTSGATVVGLVHIDQTGTSGPRQSAAAKIRVTTVGTPSAGAIRITSYYCSYTPATS